MGGASNLGGGVPCNCPPLFTTLSSLPHNPITPLMSAPFQPVPPPGLSPPAPPPSPPPTSRPLTPPAQGDPSGLGRAALTSPEGGGARQETAERGGS